MASATTAPSVSLASNSMFVNTPIYQVGNDIVFGLRVPILPDPSDLSYTTTPQTANRLDLIASMLYGDPGLFWVIADVNNIVDILFGIPEQTVLRVPQTSRLTALKIIQG